jgi:hypothetical protein
MEELGAMEMLDSVRYEPYVAGADARDIRRGDTVDGHTVSRVRLGPRLVPEVVTKDGAVMDADEVCRENERPGHTPSAPFALEPCLATHDRWLRKGDTVPQGTIALVACRATGDNLVIIDTEDGKRQTTQTELASALRDGREPLLVECEKPSDEMPPKTRIESLRPRKRRRQT